MSAEGDARPTRQSSSPSVPLLVFWPRVRSFGRLAFAGFVLLHFAFQAMRATGDASRPEPGFETEPWFVAALLLVIGLPFALFAGHELATWGSRGRARQATAKASALAFVEPLALLLVIAFLVVHCAEIAWPLLTGSSSAADVRPDLVLALSTTSHGVPIRAALYICGVGATSFYATRLVISSKSMAPRRVARVIVALGVLAYALGSFAVIRCSGGQIFP